ncbi:nucleoside deaminase [Acidomonas methanolica]|uniref:nucleoside deaminase n=1 Tax=Acidomonas methanolica TaxID=437 RepID=UPI00211A8311|nr:nucleoside deaminase [Acidomonas methanolica]MCQ9155676.1 nucleoside deaminase [Acidomonas methanolica]
MCENDRHPFSEAIAAAFLAAGEAAARGEVPVGAAVLDPGGALLAVAGNRVEALGDPSAHAELLAMRDAAARLGQSRDRRLRLSGCTVVVTLEPCPMCAAAMEHFRVARVVFGAYDPKGGGVAHGPRLFERTGCLHRPEVIGGVREREAAHLLRAFFTRLRD